MSTPVPRCAGTDSLFLVMHLLGKARKRVIFAEQTNHRVAAAIASHKGSRHASYSLLYRKTVVLQHSYLSFGRP